MITEKKQIRYKRKYQNLETKSLRNLVVDCVMQRVENHKRVALSLSGGIDSTIVGLVLAENQVEATAYSVYWSDSDKSRYNEDFFQARQTAEKIGINFRAIDAPSSGSVPDVLVEYLRIMEEPNNNPTGLSMIPLYKSITEDGIRLALTGDGADEIFGGYARYKSFSPLGRASQLLRSKYFPKFIGLRNLDVFSRFRLEKWEDWAQWHDVHNRLEISENLNLDLDKVDRTFEYLESEFSALCASHAHRNLKSLMMLDQSLWLTMESNRRLDRVSMAFSVEARSPFQDDRLFEWWISQSESSMVSGLGKKDLLRAFPEIQRLGISTTKRGFISPLGHWIRGNPEWLESNLNRLAKIGLIPSKNIKQIREISNSGNFRKLQQLWTLVVLSVWLDIQEKHLEDSSLTF